MWFKVYSPNVEAIEVVQRKQGKRARRAKLYYMRNPKHDIGSVEGVVRQSICARELVGRWASKDVKGRDANAHKRNRKAKGGKN